MHMPRKPDAAHLPQTPPGQLRHHGPGGGDPFRRVLFRPPIRRALHRQGRRRLGQNLLVVVDQYALQPRGAQIQTDIHCASP